MFFNILVFGFVHSHGTHFNLRRRLGEKQVWGRNRWGIITVLSVEFSGVAVNTHVDTHTGGAVGSTVALVGS